MMNEIKKKWWYLAWLCAGIVILFWRLDDIVGLHRDEAVFGLFVEMILDGARPLNGVFNYYTSPIHAYLLAIIAKILGNSIWSLRCLGPIFTLITIIAIYDIVRQFSALRARWISCFLITFPPVVMFSRLCGEVFVLNPFLFFGAIWVYVRLCQNQKPYIRRTGFVLAGFLMSLGVWNHIIFLPGAIALVICYAIFMWPGFRQLLSNSAFCFLGFLIGLIPRFISAFILGSVLFQKKPAIPPASLLTSLLNFLYTMSGDGLYARFSGGSVVPSAWGMLGFLIIVLATFYFFKRNKTENKIFWGIWVFLLFTFIGIWRITPFGSMGSRLWLIPAWILPILIGVWIKDFNTWKWRIIGGIVISANLLLLVANYYIPNSLSHGVISPSVYVGGKWDNTWDYYDHRYIVEKLAETDAGYIFISNINVFTFYYLMPEEQRHRIKLLWPLEIGGMGTTPEKQKLYSKFSYKGLLPKSALFVFYENDKDYLDTFSKQQYFHLTELDNEIGIPGFKVFRLK
ncbi:MAG TPA: ArnT family glycosyltransferase [Candidatus Wunengus sp. YC60]|uniref:ArnT family glycosyltransferase n=1 Tax=Candidatus Wunengus sp. YC60 TaxID=3367697 RepID=UPI004028F5AA